MAGLNLIDWRSTTHAERKILYRHTKYLKRRLNKDWQAIFEAAFSVSVGKDYENNFRKGKISVERATELFQWIEQKYLATANDIEDEIEAEREKSLDETLAEPSWEQLLRNVGQFDDVRAYRLPSLQIAGFADQEPLNDLSLKLGDEFYFQIDCPRPGVLIAFQCYRQKWYLLPVARSNNWAVVDNGTAHVPEFDKKGNIDPLSEDEDRGKHQFVFVWSATSKNFQVVESWIHPNSISPDWMNKFAKTLQVLPCHDYRICRCNMMIGNPIV